MSNVNADKSKEHLLRMAFEAERSDNELFESVLSGSFGGRAL